MKSKYVVFFVILLVMISAGCGGNNTEEPVPTPIPLKGVDIYTENCVRCHGHEGRGDGPMAISLPEQPKDLASAKEKSKAELTGIIKDHGDETDGVPTYDAELTQEETYAVIGYLRTL